MENIIATLTGLIRALGLPVTKSAIVKESNEQPNADTLFGISEILNKWQIANGAYRLATAELNNDFCPFVVHMMTGIKQFEFAVVKRIDDKSVVVYNEHWKDQVIERARFDKLYTGTLLLTEPSENSGEANYKAGRRLEILHSFRVAVVALAAVLLTASFFLFRDRSSWQLITLLILNGAGALLSGIIVSHAIYGPGKLTRALCSGSGKNSCDDLITSEASRLFQWLSWGEVGLLYFSGSLLLCFWSASSPGLSWLMTAISACSLAYVVYSLSYQAFVAKKWCLLCCSVMAVLIAEFVVLLNSTHYPFSSLQAKDWYLAATACLLPAAIWIMIKPLLDDAAELSSARKTLLKFKQNDGLFKKVLSEQPSYDEPNHEYALVLGNPASQKVITLVSNPNCGPCAEAHKTLDRLLEDKNDLQVRVVLTTPSDPTARHLVALKNTGDERLLKRALSDWYGQQKKDYPSWARKYPVKQDNEYCDTVLKKQSDWCSAADVRFTPLVIVNGHQLPESYLLEDLKYLI